MITIRGESDACLEAMTNALAQYEAQHPHADIVLYRQNSVSVRVRITDEDFEGVSKADRHEQVWAFVQGLSEEQQSQISLLLLLTPGERRRSFANEDFDNPIPSQL